MKKSIINILVSCLFASSLALNAGEEKSADHNRWKSTRDNLKAKWQATKKHVQRNRGKYAVAIAGTAVVGGALYLRNKNKAERQQLVAQWMEAKKNVNAWLGHNKAFNLVLIIREALEKGYYQAALMGLKEQEPAIITTFYARKDIIADIKNLIITLQEKGENPYLSELLKELNKSK